MADHVSVTLGPKLGKLIYADRGVVHLNALRALLRSFDQLVQPSVKDTTLIAPPGSPANGDAYIIRESTTPTGAWAGKQGKVAAYSTQIATDDTNTKVPGWEFFTPKPGWIFYDEDSGHLWLWDGAAWIDQGAPGSGVTLPISESDVTGLVADLAAINSDLALKAELPIAISDVTGLQAALDTHGEVVGVKQVGATSYTITAADKGWIIEFTSGSAVAVTVPTNATEAFAVKGTVTLVQAGAGKVTISGAGGVTLKKRSSTGATSGQEAVCQLAKVATDTWRMFGDLEA
jgi:hypothetical protein